MIKILNESTMNSDEIEQEYQQAYGKELDWKKVPCVVARDKFLSGWGGAEGKTHYQVIVWVDASQAATMCDYAKYHAGELQVANVRWNYGFKPTSGRSYSYILACDAPVFGGTDRGVVKESVRPVSESFWNPCHWFEKYVELEDKYVPDANAWNMANQEERNAMVQPAVDEFIEMYADEMIGPDWVMFLDDLTDSNYHTERRLFDKYLSGN